MKSGAFRSEAGESFWVWIWIPLTAIAICHVPGVDALECDRNNNKAPCFCYSSGTSRIRVDCEGLSSTPPVTQALVNDVFSKLRLHNNLKDTDTLELSLFKLQDSDLTTFDLTPLFRTNMLQFEITENSKLTGLSGSDTGTGTIETDVISLQYNALTTEGLDGVFKLFNGSSLERIQMQSNKLTGVPDLSTLRSPKYLDFYSNKISELKAGSFRSLTNLRTLNLNSNPLEHVRESAFLIDPPTTNDSSPPPYLFIDLYYTALKSAAFSPKSGIDKIKREVDLSISTEFDSLPQDVFLPFLEATPKHVVRLPGDKEFQCDSRVKWLQDRKKEFEYKVVGAECSNDPGWTIWDSKKVKSGSNWSVGPPGPGISFSLALIYTMYFSK